MSSTPQPAATVVLLREATPGFEMLLLRRSAKLAFHGGAWVFPGGRIDPADIGSDDHEDVEGSARRAAVRELSEEAALRISPDALVAFARWTTPEGLPRRFDTWFFMAADPGGVVRVDGGEICDHRWIRPERALELRSAGDLGLPPPTFVTTLSLVACSSAGEALARATRNGIEEYLPRVRRVPDGACSLYQDDIAYECGDLTRDGPRHRLWMLESGWRYERSG